VRRGEPKYWAAGETNYGNWDGNRILYGISEEWGRIVVEFHIIMDNSDPGQEDKRMRCSQLTCSGFWMTKGGGELREGRSRNGIF